MFKQNGTCRRCNDTGFILRTKQRCSCVESGCQDADVYMDEELIDVKERREWGCYIPPRDFRGRYLVLYLCGEEGHHEYMDLKEFMEKGGTGEQFRLFRRHEVNALWLPGNSCPHCKAERLRRADELEFMVGYGWGCSQTDNQAEIPVS